MRKGAHKFNLIARLGAYDLADGDLRSVVQQTKGLLACLLGALPVAIEALEDIEDLSERERRALIDLRVALAKIRTSAEPETASLTQ